MHDSQAPLLHRNSQGGKRERPLEQIAQRSSEQPTGKAATQERILIAATELFVAGGYEGTTVAAVAARAGVSRATVFWHFREKSSLFREAFSRLLAPFRDSLAKDVKGVESRKRLQEQLALSEQFANDHRGEIGAFVRWAIESPDLRDGVVKTLLDLNQRFSGALAQTVSEIAPHTPEAKLLATGLMLAFDGNLLLSLFDTNTRAAEERSAAIRALASLIPSDGGHQ